MRLQSADLAAALAPLAKLPVAASTGATLAFVPGDGGLVYIVVTVPEYNVRWNVDAPAVDPLATVAFVGVRVDDVLAVLAEADEAVATKAGPDCDLVITVGGREVALPSTTHDTPVDLDLDTACHATAGTREILDVLGRARATAAKAHPDLKYVGVREGPDGVLVVAGNHATALYERPGWAVDAASDMVWTRLSRDAIRVMGECANLAGPMAQLGLAPTRGVVLRGLGATVVAYSDATDLGQLADAVRVEEPYTGADYLGCRIDLAKVAGMAPHSQPGEVPRVAALVLQAGGDIVAAAHRDGYPCEAPVVVGRWDPGLVVGGWRWHKTTLAVLVDADRAAQVDRALGGTAKQRRELTWCSWRDWGTPLSLYRGTAHALLMPVKRTLEDNSISEVSIAKLAKGGGE